MKLFFKPKFVTFSRQLSYFLITFFSLAALTTVPGQNPALAEAAKEIIDPTIIYHPAFPPEV